MHITCNTDAGETSATNDFTIDNDLIDQFKFQQLKYRTVRYSVKRGSNGSNEISFTGVNESVAPYWLIGVLGLTAIVGFCIVICHQGYLKSDIACETQTQMKANFKGAQQ